MKKRTILKLAFASFVVAAFCLALGIEWGNGSDQTPTPPAAAVKPATRTAIVTDHEMNQLLKGTKLQGDIAMKMVAVRKNLEELDAQSEAANKRVQQIHDQICTAHGYDPRNCLFDLENNVIVEQGRAAAASAARKRVPEAPTKPDAQPNPTPSH